MIKIYPNKIQTIYGIARINNNGYYHITSRKEGNHGKLLHRLIFEDYYGEISPNTHIHHLDGNPLNNCILNLEAMSKSEHISYHNKGKILSDETRRKLSEIRIEKGLGKGENNPMYGKIHSENTRKKISEKLSGENHPFYGKHRSEDTKKKIGEAKSKYTLWDSAKVQYNKSKMFRKNRQPDPVKCFRLKYNGREINIGLFHDFITPKLLNDMIMENI